MEPFTLITLGITTVEKLIEYIGKIREHARQNAELTPQQEAELDARIQQITSQPWWTPGQ